MSEVTPGDNIREKLVESAKRLKKYHGDGFIRSEFRYDMDVVLDSILQPASPRVSPVTREDAENKITDGEPGVGWFEWIKAGAGTTHIAAVSESGYVYVPEEGVTADDFHIASATGDAFRLVRLDFALESLSVSPPAEVETKTEYKLVWDDGTERYSDELDSLVRRMSVIHGDETFKRTVTVSKSEWVPVTPGEGKEQ